MQLPYRYLRRKLMAHRLYPESVLGKLSAYLAMLALVMHVGGSLSRLAGNTGARFDVWFNLMAVPFVATFTIVAFRWMRRYLLWRLRNRLLVTYMFIGVVPVLLVIVMGLIAGYLLSGQFAMFLATSDIETQVQSLAAANTTVAGELASRLKQSRPEAASRGLQGVSEIGARFKAVEVDAWFRGKPILVQPERKGQHALAEPAWLKQEFRGVVVDGGQLYFRAATVVPIGRDRLVVASSIRLSREEMSRLASGIGEISLLGSRKMNIDIAGNGLRITSNVKQRPGGGRGAADPADGENLVGGAVPPPSNRFDRGVQFFGPINTSRWEDGTIEVIPLVVRTRISLLYQRLFLRIGEWANYIYAALITVAILFTIIELMALLVGVGLTRTITASVAKLYDGTQHMERGNFRHRIEVKNKDQLAALESSFNAMAGSIERLILEQKEKERLQSELSIAHEVQSQLFPSVVRGLPTLELHGVCRPARTVSGDYYDFLHFAEDRVGIAVGDISGKGISAALLMATLHSAVRVYMFGRMPERGELAAASGYSLGAAHALSGSTATLPSIGVEDPADVLWMLNRHLYTSTPPEKYATLFLGMYDDRGRTMTYSNAGHLPPLLLDERGRVRRLEAGGMVVGLFDNMLYEQGRVQLQEGDIFISYSDGITEPENEFGEFGEHRLIELVQESRHLPLARISEHVIAAVQDWIGSNEQPDDITLVLARAR